jgi:hypothetical protein
MAINLTKKKKPGIFLQGNLSMYLRRQYQQFKNENSLSGECFVGRNKVCK